MNVEELKSKAKILLGNMKIITFVGEREKMEFLINIIQNDIAEDDLENLSKKFEEIAEYLTYKENTLIKEKDFEFLSNIAEILRNQRVRVDDGVYLENPVFKVTIDDEKENQTFYFLTKDGANKFIEANRIKTKDLPEETLDNADEERRKEKTFNVERNQNLELSRLLDIIKRNF